MPRPGRRDRRGLRAPAGRCRRRRPPRRGLAAVRVAAVGPRTGLEVERMPPSRQTGEQRLDRVPAKTPPVESIGRAIARCARVPPGVGDLRREEVVRGYDRRIERFGDHRRERGLAGAARPIEGDEDSRRAGSQQRPGGRDDRLGGSGRRGAWGLHQRRRQMRREGLPVASRRTNTRPTPAEARSTLAVYQAPRLKLSAL